MCSAELDFWSWCARVAERLTFMKLNQLDHREVTEADYELLKVLFKPYYNGEYPIWQTKMEGLEPKITQNSLFDTVYTVMADKTDMS